MPRSWVVALKEWKNVVPILSITLSSDPKGKLIEMLRSIDFPVKRILVQVGGPLATAPPPAAQRALNRWRPQT